MKQVITIFRKELKEILRDRRTIIIMLFVPLFMYPLLITMITSFIEGQAQKAEEKSLRIALPVTGGEEHFRVFLQQLPNTTLLEVPADSNQIKTLIEADSIDVAFLFPADYLTRLDSLDNATYLYFYTSTNNEFEVGMVQQINESYQASLTEMHLSRLQVNRSVLQPAMAVERNIASAREKWGSAIGGIIPYFFIIFCLMGCMYPAMDLAAGEKERGTMETLLVVPASRLHIFLGKFLTVLLSGFISALAAMAGILLSATLITNGETDIQGMSDIIQSITAPSTVILLLGILLPLNAFFAAITLMLSIYAKTFKEAQSMITPLMIFAVFPAVFGMLPGIKLDYTMALIPIMNVSLAAKEIISGTAETGPLVLTYLSLLLYAGLALAISVRFFGNEKNIMRGY